MSSIEEKISALAELQKDRSLKTMTTYRIGGTVRWTVYPKDVIALSELVKLFRREKIAWKVIGKGSDLLCSDEYYDGAVILLDRTFNDVYYEGNEVVAYAGTSIIALAYETAGKGLAGLEFASGIPGTLGGCLFMNAGAYKSSMADLVKEVMVLKEDNDFEWIPVEQCGFGYRTSVFQKKPEWIIVAARLVLKEGDPEEIRELIRQRRKRRMDSQPLEYPSCGSVFRNPEGGFAWKYIDALGYRGKVRGEAQVSEKHSNFIINLGDASANDVQGLIDEIARAVKEHYGIELKTEVERFNWPTDRKTEE